MDASRHVVDPTTFLTATSGYMDPQGQAPGMRPPTHYGGGDPCRPPGTDASTLSAAYHGRYLPSMPLSTGSSFPFLGGMFTGSLPGPPTSPFRTPSNPNNMRQFWPPTPPPDGGYGRLALNTSLFPLFGAPTDNGAFLTQGLVSRMGTATHLSPLIDHKEHSFFSHGIGLGTPLTPTSHVTSPSPYPHLIPSLERHPVYGGHMTLGGKELEDLHQEADDGRMVKSHLDCLMNPSPRHDRPKSKGEGKHCCDKTLDECCKLSQEKLADDVRTHSRLDAKSHGRQPTHKVQPCKIEVSHSPSLKPDMLSPPIESPKSPNKHIKKSANAPFATDSRTTPTSVSNYEEKVEKQTQRCSQCCANIKDVKLNASDESAESSSPVAIQSVSDAGVVPPQGVVDPSVLTPVSTPLSTTKGDDHPQEHLDDKSSYEKECGGSSSVITVTDVNDKSSVDESFCSSHKNIVESQLSKLNNCAIVKHVTAAVIPTAPKQAVHRDIHPETNCSVSELPTKTLVSVEQSAVVCDQKKTYSENCVKLELQELAEKASIIPNSSPCSANTSLSNKSLIKNPSTCCKVKDMIKNTCSAKQICIEKFQDSSPSKSTNSDTNKIPSSTPSLKGTTTLSTVVNPMIVSKSVCKNNEKMQCLPMDSGKKCNPFKEDAISMKTEAVNARLDCEFAQKSNSNWTKATVSPFNWQGNSSQDEQAINLTVSKRAVKPEPSEVFATTEMAETNLKVPPENTMTSSSGVIGVCHPNPTPIAMNKLKAPSSVSSISNYSSISVLNQPTEQSTEVHILHRSSKSSFPLVNRNGTSPVPLKSTISHVTANTSIHRSLKTERLIAKRGKISEMDKMSHSGRTALATLAPKLSKNVNFGKDVQTSHTISASSSVSSTSIVFPATVNPCIPVGIAIAQQRQDTSTTASAGKSLSSVSSNTSNILSSNGHLSTNRISSDLQTQEVIREQKNQDLPMNNNPTPVDTNLLVTQGPTIVSRQWESEALTRTAMPSSWVAHGSIVAPAVWLGQGTYTAPVAPASSTVPSVTVNPLESSPISLPPGGYQLARDSITGHLLLIPTANIELMDRPSVWPTFNSSAGAMPIQQLVTQQQHHTQYEQVLPQPDSLKMSDAVEASCNVATCDIASNASIKSEDKIEDVSGQVPSVPLATGQTYAFTTFPTQCDPASFSYVLQSSTVMHLAHTQTTASIQTESGRRSQATSPLHCATPSPPPNTCSIQVSVTEDEESDNESDPECCDGIQASGVSQSVTTAIQVDMDSQTNSEEDDEEDGKVIAGKPEAQKMEMCDSAIQTETVECESPKSQPEFQCDRTLESVSSPPQIKEKSSAVNIKEDIVPLETGLEIVTSEIELAPSLPVESKPVMDFIDHHGLNLLVDSIEEFASREQESHSTENQVKLETASNGVEQENIEPKMTSEVKPTIPDRPKALSVLPTKSFSSPYKTIDTTCTDGLGLLCALAEQRFFEEALNDDSKSKEPPKETRSSSPSLKHSNEESNLSIVKENSFQSNSSLSSADSSVSSSPSHRETTEMEMRLQIEELQKKYKQKQRELELLRNKKEKEMNEEDAKKTTVPPCPEAEPRDTSKCEDNPEGPSIQDSERNSKEATGENYSYQNSDVLHNELNKSDDLMESNSGEETKCVKPLSLEKSSREKGKSKTPFFDEQAWFVRRSERIFLSDARTPSASDKSSKKQSNGSSSTHKGSSSDVSRDKKEHPIKLKNPKPVDENSKNKSKSKVLKPKSLLPKKRSMSLSSESDASSDEKSSEVESSDAASCTSENLPLSTFVEQSLSSKVLPAERQKRMSTDSECSSGQSDDMPLSVLLEQKIPELKSCILKPEDLQDNSRLLVLDEGLFYAGHITKSEDPDLYGILIDGDRAARPHMFSKEEILNAAVLEVKPIHKLQLPEGSRICAFWSQQYRCLYPGTVTKASSPLPDPSLLYVEFDDGDSGRIPLNDIRMLPSDFPIVSMEPNPFMILGKRRSRAHSQNNGGADLKSDAASAPPKTDADKTEAKKLKTLEKVLKKNSTDVKVCKDKKSKSKSPSSRSRSSSKSSIGGHRDSKSGNSVGRKESGDEKKKGSTRVLEKKPKDSSCDKSASKPKKHKKHKDDHHKHHHHHHKHHHHKKHKSERTHESVIHLSKVVDKANTLSSSEQEYDVSFLEKSNSELTMKIKKSPSPHTTTTANHEEASALLKAKSPCPETSSSDDEDSSEPPPKRQKKSKLHASQGKPSKRKDRVPSVEKSKIAAFLPVRQLWRWSGKSYKRPGAKGKAKKEFYRSIQRGKEAIKVGDCAVFLSTGRPHLPYIGRIETMWESWGGKMDVKVKWFYHPEETKSGKKLSQLKGALFQSPHFDENDVQTISHKCEVLSWDEYQQKTVSGNVEDNNDTYFLAGTYDPIMGTLILEPGVPNVCSTNTPEP